MKQIQSKNPFVRLITLGKANVAVQKLLEKPQSDALDERLIKGIFKKMPNKPWIKPEKKNVMDTFNPALPSDKSKPKFKQMKSIVFKESNSRKMNLTN